MVRTLNKRSLPMQLQAFGGVSSPGAILFKFHFCISGAFAQVALLFLGICNTSLITRSWHGILC